MNSTKTLSVGTRVTLTVTESDSGFAIGTQGTIVEVLSPMAVLVRFDGDTRPCAQIVSTARLSA